MEKFEQIQSCQNQLSNLIPRTQATCNTPQSLSPKANKCPRVCSPVTNLALNLSELTTGRVTPRRKLSLSCSSLDTPNASYSMPEHSESIESGCFVDLPTPLDSPTLEIIVKTFATSKLEVLSETRINRRKSVTYRRCNMPGSLMRHSLADITNQVHTTNQSTSWSKNSLESAKYGTKMYTDIDASSTNSILGTSAPIGSAQHACFFIEDNNSQDSGLGYEKDADDVFLFAAPTGLPLRHNSKMTNDETCSPHKYSPIKQIFPSKPGNSCPVGSLDFSSVFLKKELLEENGNSLYHLTNADEGIFEDGYLDLMDAETEHCISNAEIKMGSATMSNLFNAPIVNKSLHTSGSNEDTPVTRKTACRRNIHHFISMEGQPRGLTFKRALPVSESPLSFSYKQDPPQDDSTPIQELKRRRSLFVHSPAAAIPTAILHRCHSMSETMIKSALSRQACEPDLVGDFSKTYCLPTHNGKHQDLRYISRKTLSDVLDGNFSNVIEQAIVIDCRYPYEFHGGHIRGALNLYTHDQIIDKFFKQPVQPTNPEKRLVLIFHCEFSSERGPKLSRFLRGQDRQANKYPVLHYPELYLLDGGYKAYFETEKHQCVPQEYKPMLDKAHIEDLRHFRTKSKSWAGEQRGGKPGLRTLKF